MNASKRLTLVFIALLLPFKVELIFPWDALFGIALQFLQEFTTSPNPSSLVSDPFINMTTGQVIQYYGYPYEQHQVITEDGYILELHRIPHNRNSTTSTKMEPILVIPGILADSGCFVMLDDKSSPGFLLSNAGYDVWLHNNRGTRYTRKHTTLSPDSVQFWNFTFHEMGIYDLPAAIDHILVTTKKTEIYIIGHSMGGAASSVLLSEKPSYNEKIKALFFMAPAIHLPHTTFLYGLPHLPGLSNLLLDIFDDGDLLPYSDNALLFFDHVCSGLIFTQLCSVIMNTILFNRDLWTSLTMTKDTLMVTIARVISGVSVKTMRHFVQMVVTGEFNQFDYGVALNIEFYHQLSPPKYDFGKIGVPVFMDTSLRDNFVTAVDVIAISSQIPNVENVTIVPDINFIHLDYFASYNAKPLVYEPMLIEMDMIEK